MGQDDSGIVYNIFRSYVGLQQNPNSGFLHGHPLSPGPAVSAYGQQPVSSGGIGSGPVFGTGPRQGYSLPGRSVGGSVKGGGSVAGGVGSQFGPSQFGGATQNQNLYQKPLP